VARLSGDEFAMILPGLTGRTDAQSVVERVLSSFEDPFRLEGQDVAIGTSVGVAMHTGVERAAEQLLREADAAMYRHKQGSGRRRSDAGRP
jgi:diguanylate cyclase (GGDEF)-like protein